MYVVIVIVIIIVIVIVMMRTTFSMGWMSKYIYQPCCKMIGVTGRYVTEDFSRKVRKHREELIKFAKSLRNVEPDARSSNKFHLHCYGMLARSSVLLTLEECLCTICYTHL